MGSDFQKQMIKVVGNTKVLAKASVAISHIEKQRKWLTISFFSGFCNDLVIHK
jgi:hypothetical protein